MTEFFTQKITIYNDISKNEAESRHFDRFVVDKCQIQGGIVSKQDNTITNIVNAITVVTKDVKQYLNPRKYSKLPVDIREEYYTVQVGDYIVFGEVEDIITTSKEFQDLQDKYDGFVVRSISVSINGMSVDNVQMTNVG